MKCKICNKDIEKYSELTMHIKTMHKITTKKYYDSFFHKEGEDKCTTCSRNTKFLDIRRGYRNFCSKSCVSSSKIILAKKQETWKAKYGVDHPNKSVEIQHKRKQTCINTYGVDHPLKNKKVQNKIISTNIKKYGVKYPWLNIEVKEKVNHTMEVKYGVENASQYKIFQDKKKETSIKKYGVLNPSQSIHIKQKNKKTFLKKRLPEVIKILKNESLLLKSTYINNRLDIIVKCTICNFIFNTSYFELQQGCRKCPKCYPHYKSIAETEILNYIKNLGFKTIENSKKIIKPLELDIYIPTKKIAIEYNGLYWHSETKGKDKNYHLNKLKECQEKGINLIQIFEDEWLFKQKIVKSRLKQILNVSNSTRIHARQCIIKEILPSVKNEFLEAYHLQGKDNSKIKLGAFFNEELVSVMTFSKGNIAKGSYAKESVWELNRFCSNYNYHIPGIASKLLTFFKRFYEYKQIFSYADRRWSVGNVYYKLGFSLEKETQSNYWYIKGITRIHRFNLRKRPDEPKNIPESVLRIQEGYSKIWDCGHLKFVLNKG